MAALVLHSATAFVTFSSSHRLLFHRSRDRPKLLSSCRILSAPQGFYAGCASGGILSSNACCVLVHARDGKKVLTDVELCDEIKEFLSAVGLPEHHMPSIKELSLHGRSDLANIVRRRGYKFIKELLTNSQQMDVSGFDMQKSLSDEHAHAVSNGRVAKLEGQDETADYFTEKTNLSDEAPCKELFLVGDNLHHHVTFGGNLNEEPPVVIYSDEWSTRFDRDAVTNNKISLAGEATSIESSSNINADMEPDLDNIEHVPLDNLELARAISSSFMYDVEKLDYNGKYVSSTSDASNKESYPQYSEFDSNDDSGMSVELPDSKILEEKVMIFMKDGCLVPVDDNVYKIYEDIGGEEPDCLDCPKFAGSGGQLVRLKDRAEMPPVPWSAPAKHEDNHSSGEGPLDACMDKNLKSEMTEGEDQAQVSRLRYMLHQKELELSQLKEDIEKEKLALSFLQMKAESEINKAQKLIAEKDAELQAAEESLSGLKE